MTPPEAQLTMEAGESGTPLVVRRMKRQSLATWPWWKAYDPTMAPPDELRFEVMEEDERKLGEIVFTKFRVFGTSTLKTPWGEGSLESHIGTRVIISGRVLASFESHFIGGKRIVATFSNGTEMVFNSRKGHKDDVEYSDGKAYAGIFVEDGALPEGARNRTLALTKDEIKRLPRRERPRSIETEDYTQFRIVLEGNLPVERKDITSSLAILVSYALLMKEIPM